MKEYYCEGKIKLEYDSKKSLYWIDIDKFPIALNLFELKKLSDLAGKDLAANLHSLDSRILPKLKEKKISFSFLEKAIHTAIQNQQTKNL